MFLVFFFSCSPFRLGSVFFGGTEEDDDKKMKLKTAHTTNKTPLSLEEPSLYCCSTYLPLNNTYNAY